MKNILYVVSLFLVISSCVSKQTPLDAGIDAQNKKMEWWREARFGMFIHWGLYAVPGGEWEGRKIPGISEWIMLRAQIPVAEYEALAKNFNPVDFDAEEWVKLAKSAGMKYIVITSKHHDGFAMYHSKANKYNIVDATPFSRDPLKELADACRKHNIKLGFYHSQAQDWHHPGGAYSGMDKKPHWDQTMDRVGMEKYIDEKVVPQVKELLSEYGDIAIFWWDTPYGMTELYGKKLLPLLDMQPGIIANNRLVSGWKGDFNTPEQHVPPTGLDYDWEVCLTMNTSWGYKRNDNNWKSPETVIRMLADIASKGGNLLLNVGPTEKGIIPDSSAIVLKEVGNWMSKNGESIYGTTASPFFKLPWGRCTKKETAKGALLYLHVFEWPKYGTLRVPGLKSHVRNVYLASQPKQIFSYKFEGDDLLIHAPNVTFDPVNTVLVVDTRGKLKVVSNKPHLLNNKIVLPANFADIYNPGYGQQAILINGEKKSVIKNWIDERTHLEWIMTVSEPGKYKINGFVKVNGENKISIKLGDQSNEQLFSDSENEIIEVHMGEFQITETGDHILSLTPVKGNWNGVDLYNCELIKMN